MPRAKRASSRGAATLHEEDREKTPSSAAERGQHPVDRLFERVEPAPASVQAPSDRRDLPAGLRTARVAELSPTAVSIVLRGQRTAVAAELAEGVERDLVAQAKKNRDAVLVEVEAGSVPLIVGVIQTRIPREVVLKADKVTIEGDREVLLRSGRAAVRLREDGDVELVGSRILAMSRGLFRIVGRILRLN